MEAGRQETEGGSLQDAVSFGSTKYEVGRKKTGDGRRKFTGCSLSWQGEVGRRETGDGSLQDAVSVGRAKWEDGRRKTEVYGMQS